ncbi:hypothetical protein V6N13_099608 [Hibiscus sabdariffa]
MASLVLLHFLSIQQLQQHHHLSLRPAFSYYSLPFLLPNVAPSPTKPPSFTMDDGSQFISDSFSQFYSPHHLFHDSLLDPNRLQISEPSVGKKQSSGGGDSTVVDKLENGEQVTQKGSLVRYRKRRTRNGTALNSVKSKAAKGVKNKSNNGMKSEKKSTQPQEPPTGFIHVRARRGQATDSHSLAERVRRKKISERMKILQCLVPGCEKVTGKALMLDEIINYVHSLQNQVEFLSMKLASVSPMFYDFGVDYLDALMVKPEQTCKEDESKQGFCF